METRGDKTAIIWEGDDPRQAEHISYRDLYGRVCQCANALKSLGVAKGDRVTIYLPMVPEIAIAMLACARIGAVHSVVFAGFSSEALGGRIADCDSRLVITADEGIRGGKRVPLKKNVDGALSIEGTECVKHVLVVRRTGAPVPMYAPRDCWYEELVAEQPRYCAAEAMDAEDPLFILYTSGSTGQPKGVLHTTGGYLVYAAFTHDTVFDLREEDIYWATADIGWVTGHSYIVYGPLANGATTLMFEGVPNYPDTGRFWQVVDKHKVTIILFVAHGDSLLDARRRGARESMVAQVAASAGFRRRADQSGGMGMVPPGRGRSPLSDRRYLVADRNRRNSDCAAAGRDRPEAGIGDRAVLRRKAGHRRQ